MDIVIIGLFALMVFVFVLVCAVLVTDNRELKKQLEKTQAMYLREVEKNIERLKEEIFRDDIEILKSFGYGK